MQTHQIQVSNGRRRALEIRRELFAFPEVLEVFITSRPDALVVVCSGRPRPGEWLRALREAGYDAVVRRRATTLLPESAPEPEQGDEEGDARSPSRWPRAQGWAPARTQQDALEYSAELG